MLIGVPKEIKVHEYRVGLVPSSVRELKSNGHDIIIEKDAGAGIGFHDSQFQEAGATIVETAKEVFDRAEMVIKVKEPQPDECKMMRPDQVLFTYLHLAPDPVQTELLLESGCIAIAYETVTDDDGGLPLLAPMSEIAGCIAVQAGAHFLEKPQGGRGVLLAGVSGVSPANVVVIGGGVVGTASIRMALGMGAHVTVLDKSAHRLKELNAQFDNHLKTVQSNQTAIIDAIADADLVVGAVLIPGAASIKLITKEMLRGMLPHSVLADVAIDQGGCCETSRPTTHEDPTYEVNDVIHYCVANMPSAVPRTAAQALNNATLPYIIELANKGYAEALRDDKHLMEGLNIHKGQITYEAVAKAMDKEFVPASELV